MARWKYRTTRSLLRVALLALVCITPGGCAVFGVLARGLPPPTVPAAYTGLAGHSVAVMVWADDSGILVDWPEIRLDIATMVQTKLQQAQKVGNDKEGKPLTGATWPVEPRSVVRFQLNHPEIDALPVPEIAKRLGVQRVVYIELDDFQTRSDASVELYRGTVRARVKVIEVEGGAKGPTAKLGFEEPISTVFPKGTPEEGLPGVTDDAMYRGTIAAFTTDVAVRFIPHPEED